MYFIFKSLLFILFLNINTSNSISNYLKCGILQSLADPTKTYKFQFGGVFVPNSGIKWYSRKRNFIHDLNDKIYKLKSYLTYKDSKNCYSSLSNLENNNFTYRVILFNPLMVLMELHNKGRILIANVKPIDNVKIRNAAKKEKNKLENSKNKESLLNYLTNRLKTLYKDSTDNNNNKELSLDKNNKGEIQENQNVRIKPKHAKDNEENDNNMVFVVKKLSLPFRLLNNLV